MVEVKLNDLNMSKSLQRFANLSSGIRRHLSQMAGVIIYISKYIHIRSILISAGPIISIFSLEIT